MYQGKARSGSVPAAVNPPELHAFSYGDPLGDGRRQQPQHPQPGQPEASPPPPRKPNAVLQHPQPPRWGRTGRFSTKTMLLIVVTAIQTPRESSPVHETGRIRKKGGEGKGQRKAHDKPLVSTQMPQERGQHLRNPRLGV